MRATGYVQPLPIDHPDALVDIDLPVPEPLGRDLLVKVEAVSVNPVDTKIRSRQGAPEGSSHRVLGWDAAGTVVATGALARRFAVGDAVWYAGALERPGTNVEYHLVDERLVGRKPASLGWAQAAALPLTALTAWEALFDRLDVERAVAGSGSLLVIGGAGGVGSIAIQLARTLTRLNVIATAARPESVEWVRSLGAQQVIDHSQPLAPQVAALGCAAPGFVFATTQTDRHAADIAELIAPQGRLCLIDDPKTFSILPFKRKSVSVHWEFMYTRSMFDTEDIAVQGRILDELAGLVDVGRVRSTLAGHFGPINAANLRRAHALLESGRSRGKIVLEGFG